MPSSNNINFFRFSAASAGENSREHQPRTDWKETPMGFVFKADVPGLKKEEMTVEVDDGRLLRLRGRMNNNNSGALDTWQHRERSSGNFCREFMLRETVDVEGIRATMEDGIWTVILPKEVGKGDIRLISSNSG